MESPLQSVIESIFHEVEGNHKVNILEMSKSFVNHSESFKNQVISLFQEQHGYRIPEDLSDLVVFPSETYLRWKAKDFEEIELHGEFHLENIINSLTLKKNKIKIPNEDIDDEIKKKIEKARYFDIQTGLGWKVATVLMLENQGFPSIWFLDELKITRINISIKEYLYALQLTKGAYYWQYIFCSKADYKNLERYKQHYIENMIEALPKIFPEKDYSDIQEIFFSLTD